MSTPAASPPAPAGDVLAALRAALLAPGAICQSFTGLDVLPRGVDASAGTLVTFRWRRDVNTYAIALPAPEAVEGGLLSEWTGLPVPDLQRWVCDVDGFLTEELVCGLVRRAPRTRTGGLVHLGLDGPAPDVRLPQYYLTGVHWRVGSSPDAPEPGRGLRADGFDTAAPLRARAHGRLVSWVCAYVDSARGGPYVGHAAITTDRPSDLAAGPEDRRVRQDPPVVDLDVLQVREDTPDALVTCLAYHALRDAAEAGATTARTTLDHPGLRTLPLSTDPRGRAGSRTTDLRELTIPVLPG